MASRRGSGPAHNPFDRDDRPDQTLEQADRDLFGSLDHFVDLDALRLDGGTQPRAALDRTTISEYAEDMHRGDRFPPVTVYHDGVDHWLADGFHRVAAARKAGLARVRADVKQGTQRDAVLFSVGVNASHGKRRTNADKRRAVMVLLEDEQWNQWSDREIARKCKVSHPFVSKLREEIEALSGNRYQIDGDSDDETRLVRRGDQVYEQRVNREGRKSAPIPNPSPARGEGSQAAGGGNDYQQSTSPPGPLSTRGEGGRQGHDEPDGAFGDLGDSADDPPDVSEADVQLMAALQEFMGVTITLTRKLEARGVEALPEAVVDMVLEALAYVRGYYDDRERWVQGVDKLLFEIWARERGDQ